jgi:hypothetical protein
VVSVKLQTSDVKVASGEVEAAVQNSETRYGVKLGGLWFNGFGKCPVERGCNINLKYVERNSFRNIVEIDVPLKLSGEVPGTRPSMRDRFVAYSVALKAVATLHAHSGVAEAWQHIRRDTESLAEWLLAKAVQPNSEKRAG